MSRRAGNIEDAKECLRLIRDIADRGASSWNPDRVGYALQELTQVLLERSGESERVFEPVSARELGDLRPLLSELDFVNGCSEDMARADRN
jgi:hypothetical protein